MITVKRHIDGIALNPYEYLLEEKDGKVMRFNTESDAKEFLLVHGATEEDMYWMVFEEEEEQ